MPRVNHGPHPHQFIEDGDDILLLAEEFYLTRTIHMNSDVDPETVPASHLGYSVGRWEDDNTLVIETTRIDWPYLDLTGAPQSQDISVLERLTLSDDQSRLDYHLTITDPAFLTEPATLNRYWLALEGELQHYECVIE